MKSEVQYVFTVSLARGFTRLLMNKKHRYCYHSVNMIKNISFQSYHIKRRTNFTYETFSDSDSAISAATDKQTDAKANFLTAMPLIRTWQNCILFIFQLFKFFEIKKWIMSFWGITLRFAITKTWSQPYKNQLQCPLLNRITLGNHKIDNNNRMIQLTNVFCVLAYNCKITKLCKFYRFGSLSRATFAKKKNSCKCD